MGGNGLHNAAMLFASLAGCVQPSSWMSLEMFYLQCMHTPGAATTTILCRRFQGARAPTLRAGSLQLGTL